VRAERIVRSPRARADAGTLLARAIVADAAGAGIGAAVLAWRIHPWSSATFTGWRHDGVVALSGDAGTWLASLPERELAMRDHVLADLSVTPCDDGTFVVAALTIDRE
jgi:hypothetical protein